MTKLLASVPSEHKTERCAGEDLRLGAPNRRILSRSGTMAAVAGFAVLLLIVATSVLLAIRNRDTLDAANTNIEVG